jgi:5-hydroxyisourate hydrolase
VTLSTHVLDAVHGRPARGVNVALELRVASGDWQRIATASTDDDGRIADFAIPAGTGPATARLVFDTGTYLGPGAFYPEVVVTFALPGGDEHLHVPLLLSNYAYSTYRGS